MKYIVFQYEKYESKGGARDFLFSAKTVKEIKEKLTKYINCEDYDIVINILDINENIIFGNYYIDTMYKTNIDKRKHILKIIDAIIKDIESGNSEDVDFKDMKSM